MRHTRMYEYGQKQAGYTLIEVLVGILIFALGMMALAQLQGNLARNSTDSNARTVATNLAEEVIEAARVFGQIDSDGTNAAFSDIVDGDRYITRGGNSYRVQSTVTDYFFDSTSSDFGTDNNESAAVADFKLLEVQVTWNPNQEFVIDQDTTTTGRLGTGSITLRDIISSIPSGAAGKAALSNGSDNSASPPVDYNPGANPEIISIQLGANKFKESTTPLPDVIRSDELVETTFDVVTYSQSESGATFLRREEFRAVSCECTLRAPGATDKGGLRPTIWNGNDYTEGEWIANKPYGESANNQQSGYCDICCRDHHDGGTGENDLYSDPGMSKFNAFRSSLDYHTEGSFSGDHKHYFRNNLGELTLADSDGDTYMEACRLIRKDGFFRVAQDLRQEGLNAFPADYLDEDTEVDEYSDYVTDVVSDYEFDMTTTGQYELSPPSLTLAANMVPALVFPASTVENPTDLPTSSGDTEQQLRSRGIYIDYMTDELRGRINCLDDGGSGDNCDVPDVTTALEIIPFYDVQLTWLARWTESPNNNPVDVTNEAIADNNAHTRGMASLESGFGYSTVNSSIHSGNLGLTGTDPIDPRYLSEEEDYDLYALAVDYSTPPPLSGQVVSGDITSAVGGVKASDVYIFASDAQCDRTNTGFECALQSFATNPRLTVRAYFKRNKVLVACSYAMSVNGTEHSGTTPDSNWTRFNLPGVEMSNAHIIIKEDNCGGIEHTE